MTTVQGPKENTWEYHLLQETEMNQQEFEVQGSTYEKKVAQRNSSKTLYRSSVDPWLTTKKPWVKWNSLRPEKSKKRRYTLNNSQQSHEIWKFSGSDQSENQRKHWGESQKRHTLTLPMSEVQSRLTLKDLKTNLQRTKMILKWLRWLSEVHHYLKEYYKIHHKIT